jgi:hypothetical protein
MAIQTIKHAAPIEPDPKTRAFYVDALRILDDAGLDYAVGGGYAMAYYTGIARNTKDLDIFVREADHKPILKTLAKAGYRTEYFYPFWIAKALSGDSFIDILYNSGNGLCPVDDDWFRHAIPAEVLGYKTRLVPPEEQLFSKAFVQDRDRFDGADVNHLVLACGGEFDWKRLLNRFGPHKRVLLAHLVLFGYAYPTERDRVPKWVMDHLIKALDENPCPPGRQVCYGPNISQRGYLPDVNEWKWLDGRIKPHGPLTRSEVAQLPPP